jgi:hypothetical protein
VALQSAPSRCGSKEAAWVQVKGYFKDGKMQAISNTLALRLATTLKLA